MLNSAVGPRGRELEEALKKSIYPRAAGPKESAAVVKRGAAAGRTEGFPLPTPGGVAFIMASTKAS